MYIQFFFSFTTLKKTSHLNTSSNSTEKLKYRDQHKIKNNNSTGVKGYALQE